MGKESAVGMLRYRHNDWANPHKVFYALISSNWPAGILPIEKLTITMRVCALQSERRYLHKDVRLKCVFQTYGPCKSTQEGFSEG